MMRCLRRLGALPRKLVWDREGAIAPKGRPTENFLAFYGQLALGWIILDPGDCQAKGALERSHRFLRAGAGRRAGSRSVGRPRSCRANHAGITSPSFTAAARLDP
jgi:hypothetical protein